VSEGRIDVIAHPFRSGIDSPVVASISISIEADDDLPDWHYNLTAAEARYLRDELQGALEARVT
jgi:hypothetical protein